MASIARDTESYERWLRRQCDVVEADLDKKHKRMRKSAFDFLRATCFRWAQTIDTVCPGFQDAPQTLSVGDLHIENFGTWRDVQARLVWGVNDFDEAAVMPYPYDLIRLTTSARLAPKLRIDAIDVARAILDGYTQGLADPRPALLDEHADWLRPWVAGAPDAAGKFWRDLDKGRRAEPPAKVRTALERCLPEGAEMLRFQSLTKGGGSLGRPRYQAIAQWQGGRLVWEAKALVPSAWRWAHAAGPAQTGLLALAFGAHRSPDPHLRVEAGFVLRRSAPDAHKVELPDVGKKGLGRKLLAAMGADLGAIHAASAQRASIRSDLHQREPNWLHRAATAAERAVRADYDAYRVS